MLENRPTERHYDLWACALDIRHNHLVKAFALPKKRRFIASYINESAYAVALPPLVIRVSTPSKGKLAEFSKHYKKNIIERNKLAHKSVCHFLTYSNVVEFFTQLYQSNGLIKSWKTAYRQ